LSTFDNWNSLAHHGIKGQKWGVRRFQNPDGTLTEAGKKHAQKENYKMVKKLPHDSEYFKKARSVIPQKEFQDLLNAKKEFHENSRSMTKLQSAGEYSKPGGVQDKINLAAEAAFGKKWRKLGYANVHRIIDGYANETLDGAFQKADFGRFKKALDYKGSNKEERNSRIFKALNHDGEMHVQAYIEKRASKLIDEFWKKKTSGSIPYNQFESVAKSYCQKLAKQVGLPESEVTYYFLRDWYFNGDD